MKDPPTKDLFACFLPQDLFYFFHFSPLKRRFATNLAMNTQATQFYREFFSDLSIDRSEAGELAAFLSKLQPPPGKLVWLRSQAFRVGNEFLTDDKEKNKSLLRAINYIVHAIETNCLQ
jgi:hypothetical protein